MKYSLVILFACAFAFSSVTIAGSREQARIERGKITKNEAQHLVLKKYPGATVAKCVLKSGKGGDVWMVELTQAGSHDVTRVQVDGRTGKLMP